jgi:prepilin-type N-terminal cleavage/methylation domain-containing protein
MVRRNFGGLSAARARGGFTLVELLVVIIIIAILAAIAVPAVMRATATAQNARIKTEIDMLHMAIQQYKNEYGSYPPAVDVDTAGNPGRINKHIQRLFPRAPAAFLLNNASASLMKPNTALVGWLVGYSDDPTNPMGIVSGSGGGAALSGVTKKKLFDFDTSRVASGQFTAPSKPGSPYIYIDSASYLITGLPATVEVDPKTTKPFNPDSFQIISAGRDEKYGNDDDLSNFWPSTRKDYLDSQK